MKIDTLSPQSGDLSNFTIDVMLCDTTNWADHEDYMNLESYNISHMKPKVFPSGLLGFHGYQFDGRLERPKLWSAEYVCHFS